MQERLRPSGEHALPLRSSQTGAAKAGRAFPSQTVNVRAPTREARRVILFNADSFLKT
jgi:hypothetical protein